MTIDIENIIYKIDQKHGLKLDRLRERAISQIDENNSTIRRLEHENEVLEKSIDMYTNDALSDMAQKIASSLGDDMQDDDIILTLMEHKLFKSSHKKTKKSAAPKGNGETQPDDGASQEPQKTPQQPVSDTLAASVKNVLDTEGMTVGEIQKVLLEDSGDHISTKTISQALSFLVHNGMARKTGAKRGTRYLRSDIEAQDEEK